MFGPTLGDQGFDTALAQCATMSVGIVATIGVDDAGLLKRSATNTANEWNRINEWQQLRNIIVVHASQDGDERHAVGVYDDMVLGTGSRAIREVQASFSPAPTARTDDESTAAYDRSIRPAARKLSSSTSCSSPAVCQSFNLRQNVAPEPKSSRVGKWFQRIPAKVDTSPRKSIAPLGDFELASKGVEKNADMRMSADRLHFQIYIEFGNNMAINSFRPRKFEDHEIVDGNNKVVGHVRVKPSGILWSPKNGRDWYGISLAEFSAYMEANGKKVTK